MKKENNRRAKFIFYTVFSLVWLLQKNIKRKETLKLYISKYSYIRDLWFLLLVKLQEFYILYNFIRRFKFRFPLNIYAFTFKSYLTLSKLHFLSIITLQLNSSMDQWAYFIVSENDFPWCENLLPLFPISSGQPTNLVSTPIYFVSERDDDKHNLSHLASRAKCTEKNINEYFKDIF